jgi:hypothetical protein
MASRSILSSSADPCIFTIRKTTALSPRELKIGDAVQIISTEGANLTEASFLGTSPYFGEGFEYEFLSQRNGFFTIPSTSVKFYQDFDQVAGKKWVQTQGRLGTCGAHAILNCAKLTESAEAVFKEKSIVIADHDFQELQKLIRLLYTDGNNFKIGAISYFKSMNLQTTDAKTWSSVVDHLKAGNSVFWVSYVKEANLRSSVPESAGFFDQWFHRANYFKSAHQPIAKPIINKLFHAVAIFGLIEVPNGETYAMVFDSGYSDIEFWKLSAMQKAFHPDYGTLLISK